MGESLMRKILQLGVFGLALSVIPLTQMALAQEKVDAEPAQAEAPPAKPAAKPAQKKPAQKAAAKPVKGAKVAVRQFGSWTVSCGQNTGKPSNCSARLQLIEAKKKLPLLTWAIGFGEKGTPLMEIVTPTGVLISPGVKMEIGKVKSQSPYVSCVALGCSSRFIADKSVINALRGATEAKFVIVTLSKQIANVSVKPTGTAEMLDAMGL
jgi:invasion protein IalB